MNVAVLLVLLVGGWIMIALALRASLRDPPRPTPTSSRDDAQPGRAFPALTQRPHARPDPTGGINPRTQTAIAFGSVPPVHRDGTRRT